MASDGKEGQECPQTQDTLSGISQVFSRHKDTDPESNPWEKIQPIQQKCHLKSPKEDSPLKASSQSSSEEELPTDEALRDEARQKAQLLGISIAKRLLKVLRASHLGNQLPVGRSGIC